LTIEEYGKLEIIAGMLEREKDLDGLLCDVVIQDEQESECYTITLVYDAINQPSKLKNTEFGSLPKAIEGFAEIKDYSFEESVDSGEYANIDVVLTPESLSKVSI